MYIKGASRRSVGFWTKHLLNTVENTRAEVVEKRGLAADDLRDMMLEMKEDARLTRCENFMYIASFNPCPHEQLTEAQWERAYEIFEKQRGIPAGQARIVIEHEKEGRTHRHVIWSRVDLERMRAFPDGHNPSVCDAAKHEIEWKLGLELTARMKDRIAEKSASPKSWEMFRGFKSGFDARDVTAEVTAIFRESEHAADFVEGLQQHGYQLVQGRRAFCILDGAGQEHSLARRIDGINTNDLREFMRGFDLFGIPTVEQAKIQFHERNLAERQADLATVRHEIAWEEALARAAIEKEKIERRFVEPEKERDQGRRKRVWPVKPPEVERTTTSSAYHFEDAGRTTTRSGPEPVMPENLRGAGAQIWTAYHQSDNAKAFAAALDEQNISLASVRKEEADRSQKVAKVAGHFTPRYREGEIVAVTEKGYVYKLSPRVTGEDRTRIESFLKPIDRSQLQGIEPTKENLKARAAQRITEVQAFRELLRDTNNAERLKQAQKPGREAPVWAGRDKLSRVIGRGVKTPARVAGGLLNGAGKIADGLFEMLDPVLTPAQKREKEIMARTREAEAEYTTDISKYLAEVRRRREQERPPDRKDHERER